MFLVRMRWYEKVMAENVNDTTRKALGGGVDRGDEEYKSKFTAKLLQKLAEDHSSWWNASWLVFLLMGRPAGNHGALTMGSGKEVLDAERELLRRTNSVLIEQAQGSLTDAPASGFATRGIHGRSREPLNAFTPLIRSSRTTMSNTATSGNGIEASI